MQQQIFLGGTAIGPKHASLDAALQYAAEHQLGSTIEIRTCRPERGSDKDAYIAALEEYVKFLEQRLY